MSKLRIQTADRQDTVACRPGEIERVLRDILAQAVDSAELSLAIVGDAEIAAVNKRFLGRDGATDVIAFPYEVRDDHIDGEVIINADEAARRAQEAPHSPQDELMLYAVHGVLHLLGYDDADPEQCRRMHERSLEVLAAAGCALDPQTLLEE